jgi:UDP-N-acetylglucosamine--N-acetylmuramyl-(pentapeptide) pyrophosphoryl-undecaprenol N-acetylglucosamine transferase
MNRPVMIMAGGTGGHVFPALAVAAELRSRREIVWLGTERGIEARLVPPAGYAVEWIEVEGLRGKGLAGWVRAPWRLARAVRQARSALRRRRPGVVLGLGGFASGPGGIAAWLAGAPLVIHEQNAVAGLTNRWLARIATRIAEGFPGSFPAGSRALRRQPGAAGDRRAAAAPAALRVAQRSRDAVRLRRQPGRGGAQPTDARGRRLAA